MSSRERRSVGDSSNGLNIAMVHLLDTTRLKKELEARGLDTKGNKIVLADRLEEAIQIQKYGGTPLEKSPQKVERKKKKTNRPDKKRKNVDENHENVSSPKKISKKQNKLRSPESINFFWASEAPIEALQKIQSKNLNGKNKSLSSKAAINIKKDVLTKNDSNTVSPLRRTSRMSLRRNVVQEAINELSAEKGQKNLNKLYDNKMIKIEIENTNQNCDKSNYNLLNENETSKSYESVSKNDFEANDLDNLIVKNNSDKSCKNNNEKLSKKKKDDTHDIKFTIKTNSSVISETKDKKVIVDYEKKVEQDTAKIANTQQKTQTTKPLKIIISTQQKGEKNITNYEANVQSPSESPCGSTATSFINTNAQLSSPSLSPSGSTNALKRCDLIKKHTLSNSVDLLDMIFVKQDRLLADKYKSDQEKAIEKNLFELQKRKSNTSAITLYEKKDNKLIGNMRESRSNSIDKSPVLCRSKDFIDNNFDPRDPLNLRSGTNNFSSNLSKNCIEPSPKLLFAAPVTTVETSSLNRINLFNTSPLNASTSISTKFTIDETSNKLAVIDKTDLIVPPPPPPPKLLLSKIENEENQRILKKFSNEKIGTFHEIIEEEIIIPPPPPKISLKENSLKIAKSLSPVNNCDDTIIPPSPPPLKSRFKHLNYELLLENTKNNSLITNDDEIIIPPPPPPPKLHKKNKNSEVNALKIFTENNHFLNSDNGSIDLSLRIEKTVEKFITKDINITKKFSTEEASISLSHKNFYNLLFNAAVNERTSKIISQNCKDNFINQQSVSIKINENSGSVQEIMNTELCVVKEGEEKKTGCNFVENNLMEDVAKETMGKKNEQIDNKNDKEQKIFEKNENLDNSLKEDNEKIDDTLSVLLKNPKALLQKASDVLKRINGAEHDESLIEYNQIDFDTSSYIIENEQKPLPDFHGEPVPDDDEEDDVLFEIAAGLRPLKKRDLLPIIEDEPLPDDEFIELDYYNADMNIKASSTNKWLIDPDNQDGFALMWGGVKSNYGISVKEEQMPKKIAFQIKIIEFLSLKHVPFEEIEPHDVRIGWSALNTTNMLGESSQSYMFCSNARKATGNIFVDYGDPFSVNNVITTVLDFQKREISYYKNQNFLGVAFSEVDFPIGSVVFPHIATKNCKVLVNFGLDELPEGENFDDWRLPEIEENFDKLNEDINLKKKNCTSITMIGRVDKQSGLLVPSKRPPLDKAHCTVIAMVGLPGAGKTTWVKQYLREHSDEHWILFNTDSILSCMTVNGIPRRRVHQGRWDMVMGLTAKALTRSLQMACRRRHNYILDQTNVSREARKKKLTQFADFQRKCVVMIPSEDELERRLLKQARQDGSAGQIPVEAMLELKGSFSIPCTESEPIEDVFFVEPPISRINEAIELVKKYNDEGRPWIRKTHPTQKPESVISDSRDTTNPWIQNTRSTLF